MSQKIKDYCSKTADPIDLGEAIKSNKETLTLGKKMIAKK